MKSATINILYMYNTYYFNIPSDGIDKQTDCINN